MLEDGCDTLGTTFEGRLRASLSFYPAHHMMGKAGRESTRKESRRPRVKITIGAMRYRQVEYLRNTLRAAIRRVARRLRSQVRLLRPWLQSEAHRYAGSRPLAQINKMDGLSHNQRGTSELVRSLEQAAGRVPTAPQIDPRSDLRFHRDGSRRAVVGARRGQNHCGRSEHRNPAGIRRAPGFLNIDAKFPAASPCRTRLCDGHSSCVSSRAHQADAQLHDRDVPAVFSNGQTRRPRKGLA